MDFLFNFTNFNACRSIPNSFYNCSYTFAPAWGFNTGFPMFQNFAFNNINIFDIGNTWSNSFSAPNNFNTSIFNFTPDFSNAGFNFNNFNLNSFSFSPVNFSFTNNSKSSVNYRHWATMDDAEMRKFFGDYDFDVTQKFTGSADDLNKFLEKYPNSKLNGKGQAFIDAQNRYNISALVLLAICGAETSYGTDGSAVERNNFANIEKESNASYDGRWRKFNSVEDCIMELARLLRENYVDSPGKGKVAHLTKLYQIGPKFCPAKEDGSGAGWAKLVQGCMNDINKAINA